jgi:hypothetical protein
MNTEGANQTQTQRGAQQSQSQGNRTQKPEPQKPDPHARASVPGEDPDTLTEEDYSAGDPHPDSRPDSRRDQTVDPERSGGAQDRSQSI